MESINIFGHRDKLEESAVLCLLLFINVIAWAQVA